MGSRAQTHPAGRVLRRGLPAAVVLFLLVGCASTSVCDRTCLGSGNDQTLYLRLRNGARLTMYEGLYTVALAGDSGTITGMGLFVGDSSRHEPQWSGTVSLAEVAAIETKHFSILGTLVGVSLLVVPGVLLKIFGV